MHAKTRATPGGWRRGSTPGTPDGTSNARWPSRWWRQWATGRASTPPPAPALPGPAPLGILPGRAAAAGSTHPGGSPPGPPGPPRRRLGRPLSGARQPPPPMAPGAGAADAPGPQLAGTRAPGSTRPAAARPRPTRASGRGGEGTGRDRLPGGHGSAATGATRAPPMTGGCIAPPPGVTRLSAAAPPRGGVRLDRVKRREEPLVPSARPAPDGGQYGGTHPTDLSRSTRRV